MVVNLVTKVVRFFVVGGLVATEAVFIKICALGYGRRSSWVCFSNSSPVNMAGGADESYSRIRGERLYG